MNCIARILLFLTFAVLVPSAAASVPIVVEAESGTLGGELQQSDIGGSTGITATTDGAGNAPGTAPRVASYSVTFPEAGTYQLYSRLYVGSSGASDDSFFYGNGFGTKDAAAEGDWITVNQLASGVGSTETDDYVPGVGAAGQEVWKWVMLSGFSGGETPISFDVPAGSLTQTFQFGAREDGLYVDKFAFGYDGYFYTVGNLDNGEAGTESTPNEPYTPTGPPIAKGKSKWLGNIYAANQLEGFEAYWNQVTPENAGKWGSVEGTRDVMNWGGLDASYELAKANGFPFRFHVLVWGAQQPGWINDLSPAEQREEIEEWMAAVAERYPDIDYLEVVNEPLNQAPDGGDTGVVSGRANYVDALGGDGETGWDWVITSFQLARQYFPDTPLVINEYGIISNATTVNRYLALIDLLIERDLIDVIGFQGHAFSTRVAASTMRQNLDTLASRGLPIMVTEFDVDGPTDASQLSDYQRIFPVFWEHPAVIGVTLWGFRPGLWRNEQGAYLVLANGAERPAMVWLKDYVGSRGKLLFTQYLEQNSYDATEHAFGADADGDRWPTGFEYFLGSDPTVHDSGPLDWDWSAGALGLELPFSDLAAEGVLELLSSDDLVAWETVARFDLLTGEALGLSLDPQESGTVIQTDQPLPTEPGARFYTIRFSIPAEAGE